MGGKPSTTNWVRKVGGAPEARVGRDAPPRTRPRSPWGRWWDDTCEGLGRASRALLSEDSFGKEMMAAFGARCRQRVEDSLCIGIPCYSHKWDNLVTYEGFTMRRVGIREGHEVEEKLLFVRFPRAHGWFQEDFTPALMALIELAEAVLACDRLFVCLDRDEEETNSLIRSLMYVGFQIAEQPNSPRTSRYIALEYETGA